MIGVTQIDPASAAIDSPAVRVEDLNFAFFSVDFLIKPGSDNTW
jgi:hypothetical protein